MGSLTAEIKLSSDRVEFAASLRSLSSEPYIKFVSIMKNDFQNEIKISMWFKVSNVEIMLPIPGKI